jgi:flagellar biosynthesis/type III secretory pathway M-ring protein FliF/YscJ
VVLLSVELMDRKTKILFVLLLLLIIVSVAATYYKYVVRKDYDTYVDDYSEEGTDENVTESTTHDE